MATSSYNMCAVTNVALRQALLGIVGSFRNKKTSRWSDPEVFFLGEGSQPPSGPIP